MDNEFIKWLATLGVGGVLAGFMFHFYRKDVRQYTELWKGQSDLVINVVKDVTTVLVAIRTQVEQHNRTVEDLAHQLRRMSVDNDARGERSEARDDRLETRDVARDVREAARRRDRQ